MVTKKGPTKGSGGKHRNALKGKGPTPKAEDRVYHKAYRAKRTADRRKVADPRIAARRRVAKFTSDSDDLVIGRNAVLEAAEPYQYSSLQELAERAEKKARAMQSADSAEARIAARPLFIALDGVTDPQNLGAVIRSAAAFGANGVILPERRSASVTAAAWKVSAGAAAHMPVARVVNLTKALESLKEHGYYTVGLDGGGDALVGETGFESDPLVVVLGSEGKGLSRLVREACDSIAGIPITNMVESLNASVAAGISLYAVARARREAAAGTATE
jgi:23S rRNA (guanosine2251-2'-O)-methyltransferase